MAMFMTCLLVGGEALAEQGVRAGEQALLEAIEHMQQQRCDKAIPLLKRSYETGKLRNALWNLAECYKRVKRPGFAIETYRRYLERPATKRQPSDQEAARAAISELMPTVATLRVTCPVKGARVYISGYDLGQTPLTTKIGAGLHVVEVSAVGYATSRREVQLDPGDERRLDIPLELEPGRLTVTSEPTGAEVRLDGELLGRTGTDTQEREVPSGGHVVRLSLEGYRSVDRFVTLQPDQVLPLAVTLEPVAGRLDVTTGVEEARVLVDGEERGSGAFSSLELSPGRYDLQIDAADHAPWSGPVEIIDHRVTSIELDLARDGLNQTWFWITAAAALGSLVAGAVLVVDARTSTNDFERVAAAIDAGGVETLSLRETQAEWEDAYDYLIAEKIGGIVLMSFAGLATIGAALLGRRTQFRRPISEAAVSTFESSPEPDGLEGDAP